MKINNLGRGVKSESLQVVNSRNQSRVASEASDGSEQTDAIQLSELSTLLSTLQSGSLADVQHVQRLIGVVRGGTYQADSLVVSRRIVEEALSPD